MLCPFGAGARSMLELTNALRAEARQLGFALTGVCPAVAPAGITRFQEWLDAGYAGEMHYLPDRAAAYAHPGSVLNGARSMLMLGMHYHNRPPAPPADGFGRVSRYAWGDADYHDVIHKRLKRLKQTLISLRPEAAVRGVVDTAPILEREFAQLAGLGWIGKNTMLLNRDSGSYFFLAALLTDVELEYDAPHESDHCGTCTACLDACPTAAFPKPYQLDATRCISYLTIELRDQVPDDLRTAMGDWLFGCDICQDVCPWNSRATEAVEREFEPRDDHNPVELAALFAIDDSEFRRRFRNTPLWRSKRRGILRNAAIVLGNQRHTAAHRSLAQGLNDSEPLVRGACAWALGQLQLTLSRDALQERLKCEQDEGVRREIRQGMRE
jgi:epoxyqueuosine reductase